MGINRSYTGQRRRERMRQTCINFAKDFLLVVFRKRIEKLPVLRRQTSSLVFIVDGASLLLRNGLEITNLHGSSVVCHCECPKQSVWNSVYWSAETRILIHTAAITTPS